MKATTYTERLNIRISADDRRAMEALAQREGKSIAELIRSRVLGERKVVRRRPRKAQAA